MKVYQKDDKLPTNIDVAKDEISTADVILPIDADEIAELAASKSIKVKNKFDQS